VTKCGTGLELAEWKERAKIWERFTVEERKEMERYAA
jgi:hypothetical protein